MEMLRIILAGPWQRIHATVVRQLQPPFLDKHLLANGLVGGYLLRLGRRALIKYLPAGALANDRLFIQRVRDAARCASEQAVTF